MLNIQYYKTNLGLLVFTQHQGLINYYYNDEKLELKTSWSPKWSILDTQEITGVFSRQAGKRCKPMWVLCESVKTNPQVTALNLPESFVAKENEDKYCNSEYDYHLASESPYHLFSNLYERKYTDREADTYTPVEFELECLNELEIAMPESPVEFSYKIQSKTYDRREKCLTQKDLYSSYGNALTPDQVFSVFNPEIFWHTKPCKTNADTTFKIIREHIRSNINGKYARITSDYDFCLTVKKVIPVKPWVQKTEQLTQKGKSYKQPRFITRTISKKEVEVFECAPKAYQKYTVVQGFKGDNLADLKANIDKYLEDLMEVINAPLVECECCNGYGHKMESISCNGGENRV